MNKSNKRIVTIIILVLLTFALFLLSACGKKYEPTYTVEYGDEVYTIDTIYETITYKGDTYKYSMNGGAFEIEYPNGAIYWWQQNGNAGHGGWSDNYDSTAYVSGEVLVKLIYNRYNNENKSNNTNPLIIILLLGAGIWNVVSPYSSWDLSHGWRYKDAEPSDFALVATRCSGVFAIIVALFLIIF